MPLYASTRHLYLKRPVLFWSLILKKRDSRAQSASQFRKRMITRSNILEWLLYVEQRARTLQAEIKNWAGLCEIYKTIRNRCLSMIPTSSIMRESSETSRWQTEKEKELLCCSIT